VAGETRPRPSETYPSVLSCGPVTVPGLASEPVLAKDTRPRGRVSVLEDGHASYLVLRTRVLSRPPGPGPGPGHPAVRCMALGGP